MVMIYEGLENLILYHNVIFVCIIFTKLHYLWSLERSIVHALDYIRIGLTLHLHEFNELDIVVMTYKYYIFAVFL